jgi:hypothetical protein
VFLPVSSAPANGGTVTQPYDTQCAGREPALRRGLARFGAIRRVSEAFALRAGCSQEDSSVILAPAPAPTRT